MFVTFNGEKYRVSFVHHNPMKKHVQPPRDDTRAEFVGTQCTIQAYFDDQPGAYVRSWAHLHDHLHVNKGNIYAAFCRRYEQFEKKIGRMVSLRRTARLMFGEPVKFKDETGKTQTRDVAEDFVKAYLMARTDYTTDTEHPRAMGY